MKATLREHVDELRTTQRSAMDAGSKSRKRKSESIAEDHAKYASTLGLEAHTRAMDEHRVKLSIDTYGLSGPNTTGMAIRPAADRLIMLVRGKKFVGLYSRNQVDLWKKNGWEEIPGMFFPENREVPESWMVSGQFEDEQHGGVVVAPITSSSSSSTPSSSSSGNVNAASSEASTAATAVTAPEHVEPDGWWGRWNKHKTLDDLVVYYETVLQTNRSRYSSTKGSKDQLRKVAGYYDKIKTAKSHVATFDGARPFKVAEW